MSRCVVMSASGDPFILSLLLKLWNERWRDEVDHFYLNINNHCKIPIEPMVELIGNIIKDPKITLIWHPSGIGNGPPQTELLKICNEDLVLLLEDDFYIFESGVVDGFFKRIESGETDILGSPRYAAGEVAEAAQKKFNLDYSGMGDKGFGWWPCGFYCKREDLLKTDLDFGSKVYKAGEYFKELDHTFVNEAHTDTFTWASVQLRYLGLKDIEIPQNHASPDEIEEYEKRQLKWAGDKPRYIHAGSLSAGWNGYLQGQIPDLSNQNAILEMETRCAFWTIASDVIEGFNEFKRQYQEGIAQLVAQGNLDRNRIDRKIQIYKSLMKL